MHIVQALVALNLGGSELVSVELTEFLREQGHRVTVIAAQGPLSDRVNNSGAEHLDWAIGKKSLSTFRNVKTLRSWIKKTRPDLLHVHSRVPAWICWQAMKPLQNSERPVFVTSMHGQYTVSPYSAIMSKGDRVIAVSDFMREYTLKNYPKTPVDHVVTIHGGISQSAFPHGYKATGEWWQRTTQSYPEIAGKRLLCLPGRVSQLKGHTNFIRLISLLRDKVANVHGIIVGGFRAGSSYQRELNTLSDKLGVSDRLTYTGATTEMRDWLSVSDIVYNLSNRSAEAFGRTVLEALMLGRPVLAWDRGGASELLKQLFPLGRVRPEDMDALVRQSVELLEDPVIVPPSQAFSLKKSMGMHLELYQSLIQARTA